MVLMDMSIILLLLALDGKMGTPGEGRTALSDVTNIPTPSIFMHSYFLYKPSSIKVYK